VRIVNSNFPKLSKELQKIQKNYAQLNLNSSAIACSRDAKFLELKLVYISKTVELMYNLPT